MAHLSISTIYQQEVFMLLVLLEVLLKAILVVAEDFLLAEAEEVPSVAVAQWVAVKINYQEAISCFFFC